MHYIHFKRDIDRMLVFLKTCHKASQKDEQ